MIAISILHLRSSIISIGFFSSLPLVHFVTQLPGDFPRIGDFLFNLLAGEAAQHSAATSRSVPYPRGWEPRCRWTSSHSLITVFRRLPVHFDRPHNEIDVFSFA